MVEFQAWPKIPRLHRDVIITEKLDGTNACVVVSDDPSCPEVFAQSRKRLITPADDNFGFARWVREHNDELLTLGPGHHFGEWYGLGIQRNYGLDEKRFALFNTLRWNWKNNPPPECCGIVPIIFPEVNGADLNVTVEHAVRYLRVKGSLAVPGFAPAEGIVIYHTAARQAFKVLLEGDSTHKGGS